MACAIVFDCGSHMFKAGRSGHDAPIAVFPPAVGKPRHPGLMVAMGGRDTYIGDEAFARRGVLTLNYPIEQGIVTNWDDMQKILHHAFYNEFLCAPEEQPVFVVEPVLNPKANREKMMEIMFETFNVPAYLTNNQSTMALFAAGRSTGILLESGDGMTRAVPIYEGHVIPTAISQLDLGGRDILKYLVKEMNHTGLSFNTSAEMEIARDIKEKNCYIALDVEEQMKIDQASDRHASYELPDGQFISVTTERFRCPEALFRPSLLGRETGGIHEMILTCVMKSDQDLTDQFKNVVLAGGNTMFPGIVERLQKELARFDALDGKLKVVAPVERKYSSWIGASMVASLFMEPRYSNVWVSEKEYGEFGSNIVHRKCF